MSNPSKRAIGKGGWIAFAAGATLVLGVPMTCAYYGIWGPSDYRFYRHVTTTYPIGRDLWWGRIKAGDSMESLLARVQPESVARFGRWTEARWYDPYEGRSVCEGLVLIAGDGRLLRAYKFSCFGAQYIFDEMSPSDEADHAVAEKKHRNTPRSPAAAPAQ